MCLLSSYISLPRIDFYPSVDILSTHSTWPIIRIFKTLPIIVLYSRKMLERYSSESLLTSPETNCTPRLRRASSSFTFSQSVDAMLEGRSKTEIIAPCRRGCRARDRRTWLPSSPAPITRISLLSDIVNRGGTKARFL